MDNKAWYLRVNAKHAMISSLPEGQLTFTRVEVELLTSPRNQLLFTNNFAWSPMPPTTLEPRSASKINLSLNLLFNKRRRLERGWLIPRPGEWHGWVHWAMVIFFLLWTIAFVKLAEFLDMKSVQREFKL